jgi:hypothetical protein
MAPGIRHNAKTSTMVEDRLTVKLTDRHKGCHEKKCIGTS